MEGPLTPSRAVMHCGLLGAVCGSHRVPGRADCTGAGLLTACGGGVSALLSSPSLLWFTIHVHLHHEHTSVHTLE